MPTGSEAVEVFRDRITQLQDATDELVTMMFENIDYLTKKATFKQVSPDMPVTQEIADSEDPVIYEANKTRMVEALLIKAKQMECLINVLPSSEVLSNSDTPNAVAGGASNDFTMVDDDPDFSRLEAEMQQVNEDYLSALAQAEILQIKLQDAITSMLDEHRQGNSRLITT